MPNIVLYTKSYCPYCVSAKRLLTGKGHSFVEIDVGSNPDRRPEMIARAGGGETVPQIFINECHVGGCDDLHALDKAGKLDPLLVPR